MSRAYYFNQITEIHLTFTGTCCTCDTANGAINNYGFKFIEKLKQSLKDLLNEEASATI